jgi:hypothetical protein
MLQCAALARSCPAQSHDCAPPPPLPPVPAAVEKAASASSDDKASVAELWRSFLAKFFQVGPDLTNLFGVRT